MPVAAFRFALLAALMRLGEVTLAGVAIGGLLLWMVARDD
jgi:hypothetical protein